MSLDKIECFKCHGDGQTHPYGNLSIPKCMCSGCEGHGYIDFYYLKCPKCHKRSWAKK